MREYFSDTPIGLWLSLNVLDAIVPPDSLAKINSLYRHSQQYYGHRKEEKNTLPRIFLKTNCFSRTKDSNKKKLPKRFVSKNRHPILVLDSNKKKATKRLSLKVGIPILVLSSLGDILGKAEKGPKQTMQH